ncbi:NUDIX domain-containing protein [Neobacillus mesonae]|nr:NUDIX domain-containing protein [Neobacillus mesonae]
MDEFLQQFKTLNGAIHWGIVQANLSLDTTVNESLISNISIIPVVGDQYVVMQLDDGRWELIGGTLEPDEHYMDGLRRELMEEIGAELVSYQPFGHFQCTSSAEVPYRSHIPHPNFIRLLGYGEVNIVAKPLNPEDGEQVALVELVDIDEAVRRFESIKRYDIAEMYRLAHIMKGLKDS